MTTIREAAFQYVKTQPGLTSEDIAGAINAAPLTANLGATPANVSGALGSLARECRVARYRVGRSYRYIDAEAVEGAKPDRDLQDEVASLTGRLTEAKAALSAMSRRLTEAKAAWERADDARAEAEDELDATRNEARRKNVESQKYIEDGRQQVLAVLQREEALQEQVAALEAWRDEAAKKYPDLIEPDPDLLKAREIVAGLNIPEGAEKVAVQAVLATLRSVQPCTA